MEIYPYIEDKGKRKSSLAKVILYYNYFGTGDININGQHCNEYLQGNPRTLKMVYSPLSVLGLEGNYTVLAFVSGGGICGQAEAIRLGISRALSRLSFILGRFEDRKKLKINGFLTRNSLCKERRKYGLKKARKAPQFSKR